MVEFAEFIRILRRGAVYVVLSILFFAIVAAILIPRIDGRAKFDMVVSLRFDAFVQDRASAAHDDGYYLIEAERRFGDVLGTVLIRPDVRGEIEERAGITLGRASRISPLDYRLPYTLTTSSIDDAGVVSVVQARVHDALIMAVTRSGEPIRLGVSVSHPVRSETIWTPLRAALAGAFLGAFFAIFVLLFRHAAMPQVTIVEEVLSVEIES